MIFVVQFKCMFPPRLKTKWSPRQLERSSDGDATKISECSPT